MRRILLLLIVVVLSLSGVMLTQAESSSEMSKPKLIAKTLYDVKFVRNKETGQVEERKTARKVLYEIVNKKAVVPDPLDPSKTITISVPTEVPYTKNKRSSRKLNKLKKRLEALQKRERHLKSQYKRAHDSLVDHVVLEDGAPAPPDRQQIKMAQELYEELEATQLPKAKNIKQDDLRAARAFVVGAGAQREATWNLFDEMKEKLLVPKHGWSMEM